MTSRPPPPSTVALDALWDEVFAAVRFTDNGSRMVAARDAIESQIREDAVKPWRIALAVLMDGLEAGADPGKRAIIKRGKELARSLLDHTGEPSHDPWREALNELVLAAMAQGWHQSGIPRLRDAVTTARSLLGHTGEGESE